MKKKKLINLSTLLKVEALLFIGVSVYAQEQNFEKFIGYWKSGDVTFQSYIPSLSAANKNQYLRFEFDIAEKDGRLTAKMKSPDSNVLWMDADKTMVSNDTIKLSFKAIKGIFTGVLNDDKNQIVGSLNFLGRMFPIGLAKNE